MGSRFVFAQATKEVFRVGDGHIPAFIFDSGTPVFFDPGVSAFGPRYHRVIRDRIGSRSSQLLMLLTHSHFDHCGAAPYLLRKLPGARVGCSAQAAEVLQKKKAIELIRRFNAEYEQQMQDELQGEDTGFTALPVDLPLREGDRVELACGTSLAVHATPGHTRDCLSYFWAERGVLFAGEAAGVPEGDFIHSIFLSDYALYVDSIRKIRRLAPQVLCIAHVGILEGAAPVAAYLDASLAAAEAYRDKLERYLARYDDDIDRVVEEITAEEYDSQPEHILNRNPFMTNLRAKTGAVMRLRVG